jgi:hypothetical protein
MSFNDQQYSISINSDQHFLRVTVEGWFSLQNAIEILTTAIDHALLHEKKSLLIDVNKLTGSISLTDRFRFSETITGYYIQHALGKIGKIAVVGQEPIVDPNRFGETVARNRGLNVFVFTDTEQAIQWLSGTGSGQPGALL